MKKNMLLALLIATFFSCTEVLDEIEVGDSDSQLVIDSLNSVIDELDSANSVADNQEDSDSSSTDSQESFGNEGGFYSDNLLSQWKSRIKSGPYKSEGDLHINSPQQWYWINNFAEDFREKGTEVWSGESTRQTLKMLGIHCAALKARITGDTELTSMVINALRKQADTYNDFQSYYPGSEDGYAMAGWMLRLFNAYQLTGKKDEKIESYFIEVATWYKDKIDGGLLENFPQRSNNDYSVRNRAASNGSSSGEFTHVNPDGSKGNEIYNIHKWYNNRRSSIVMFFGVVGIELEAKALIESARRYYKEMIMFGTFPDGTMGEYERNGDYNTPFSGVIYGGVNIECLMQLAHRSYLKGDNSLYEFTTSKGIYGSEGGKKNLRLLIDNYLDLVGGRKKIYYKSVSESNLLDCQTDTKMWANFTSVCLANHYYQSDIIKADYTRDFTNKKMSSTGRIWYSWGGVTFNTPGYLFMFGGLEGQNSGGL